MIDRHGADASSGNCADVCGRVIRPVTFAVAAGRIDHLSVDVKNRRLFVAALGNDTIEVIDLKVGKRLYSITGLREPQGVLYIPAVNRLYVANGGDGSLRMFDGSSFQLIKTIPFGDDADNVRYDSAHHWIYVGYGDGALGAIDLEGRRVGKVKLDAHPESFQIEDSSHRIFVNLPGSKRISVVDQTKGTVVASWATGRAAGNFPMAFDQADQWLFVVCRSPARMIVLNTISGSVVANMPAVEDSDDVFYDQARKRIYAPGGAGAIWVYQQQDADHYRELARIRTVEGARTGFFSPELNSLFVATRQHDQRPAEIRIYKPK